MVDNGYIVGVDVGASFCKAIALNSNGGEVVSEAITLVRGAPEKASLDCLKQIAKKLNTKAKGLKKRSVATGQNGDKISIKDKVSEITSIGKGAFNLNRNVNIVADVGSFSVKAIKLDDAGNIKDFMMNNKCAGGSGVLLELVAEGLEMKVEELSDKAFESTNPIAISSQCSIFAESEVISYKNEGANIADLVAGVCNSIAGRVFPMIRKLDKQPHGVLLSGGVALNKKIVQNLEERLKLKLIDVSLDPRYLTAYGAAVVKMQGGVK